MSDKQEMNLVARVGEADLRQMEAATRVVVVLFFRKQSDARWRSQRMIPDFLDFD